MLQSEFEARVKMQVSCEEYQSINEVYNNSEVDKDEFCAIWVKMNRTRVKRAIENRKKSGRTDGSERQGLGHLYESESPSVHNGLPFGNRQTLCP